MEVPASQRAYSFGLVCTYWIPLRAGFASTVKGMQRAAKFELHFVISSQGRIVSMEAKNA